MARAWTWHRRIALTLGLGSGLLAGPALAMHHDRQGGHAMPPAASALQEATDRMHQEMMIEPSGDPDVDFARGMIPHHQGAIDMARVVLEHGQDPEIRGLAEAIIEAQESEIAFLRAWLERKNAGPD